MQTKTINLSDAARGVLRGAVLGKLGQDWLLTLPPGQLDRKLYLEINNVLELAGGKWQRALKGHSFDADPSEALGLAVAEGKAVDEQKSFQAYYTPPPLVARMIELADLRPDHIVLEPSAGDGAIALEVRKRLALERIFKHRDPSES